MRNDPRPTGPAVPPPLPGLEDELEEAAELLAQQEPPEARFTSAVRPDPSTPTDYAEPALIDPAD
jgi:hypothetical protein